MIASSGFKQQIPFWTALVSFAVAAGYVCETRLVQNRISSLSLDLENLDMLLDDGKARTSRSILRKQPPL